MDEQTLEGLGRAGKIVAVNSPMGVEMHPSHGRHHHMFGLKKNPFMMAYPHPFIVNGIAKDATTQGYFTLG